MRKKDPLGYYAVLGVQPDGSQQEVRLAYEFLKSSFRQKGRQSLQIGRIEAAYQTLSDPKLRKLYDNGRMRGPRIVAAIRPHMNSVGLLVSLAVIFVVVLAFIFGPTLRASLTNFSPGDTLYWEEDGGLVGTILAYESDHSFPNGMRAAAYQVRPEEGEDPRWYPARDLKRHCERR